MYIRNYTPRFSMPLENRGQISGGSKSGGTDKAPEKEDFLSHFSSPDDVKPYYDSYGSLYYQLSDPSSRLSGQWSRWRDQLGEDPDADLPSTAGWTEENVAYLKNRYASDGLTWVEREDALKTMQKLGMISGPQFFDAHREDLPLLNIKTEADFAELRRRSGGDLAPTERDWNVLFKNTPIASFSSIDDILNWAKALPEETGDPLRCRLDVRIDASLVGFAGQKG